MANFERRAGRAVLETAHKPVAPALSTAVPDRDTRVEPDLPPGLPQAPHEIDVFAQPQLLYEATLTESRTSNEQGRTWDESESRPVAHELRPAAHVEGRAHSLETGQHPTVSLEWYDSRRDSTHQRIVEMPELGARPSVLDHAVRVHEGDDLLVGSRDTGVAGGGRAPINGAPDETRTELLCDTCYWPGIGGSVIHHHDRGAYRRRQERSQAIDAIEHGHHDDDRGGWFHISDRRRMRETTIDEYTGHLSLPGLVHRDASRTRPPESLDEELRPLRQATDAPW